MSVGLKDGLQVRLMTANAHLQSLCMGIENAKKTRMSDGGEQTFGTSIMFNINFKCIQGITTYVYSTLCISTGTGKKEIPAVEIVTINHAGELCCQQNHHFEGFHLANSEWRILSSEFWNSKLAIHQLEIEGMRQYMPSRTLLGPMPTQVLMNPRQPKQATLRFVLRVPSSILYIQSQTQLVMAKIMIYPSSAKWWVYLLAARAQQSVSTHLRHFQLGVWLSCTHRWSLHPYNRSYIVAKSFWYRDHDLQQLQDIR